MLIIDDDYSVTTSLGLLLKQAGHATSTAATPEQALQEVERGEVDLVLQDMNFSRRTTGEEGLELLRALKKRRPEVPVILITAWGSIELAVEGMKAGAADFITKPWSNEQIVQAVETARGLARAQPAGTERVEPTRADLDARYDLGGVVGEDPRFLRVLDLVCRVSDTDASVLITGESGTGKEVIAEVIHRNSRRRDRPLVKVNLGGIPSTLFESEMFGHVRGAFTDARQDRVGRFAAAMGGSIFLDEIAEIDTSCQVKLLRVLQDRTYEVLGSSTTRTLDVRVISATNRDLPAAVESGRFREDLLYRLNLIAVHMPTLAERRGDIPLVAQHLAHEIGAAYGRPDLVIAAAALEWLQKQEWPGNVRQLKHLVERTILMSEEPLLDVRGFQQMMQMDLATDGDEQLPAVGSMTLQEIERAMILKSLRYHEGNLSRVAESLGMSRAALYRRLERHGIRT
ncbi:MAG: sigma-54-dependent Fis family transcriptional regulator [Candidatus Latescibacterota bacterium]|nr:MAG: sigma-54-dependent Fis family transcriptional regulator [Candidatus Latescibacterota bacterium]